MFAGKHHNTYVTNLNVAEEKLGEAVAKHDVSTAIALQVQRATQLSYKLSQLSYKLSQLLCKLLMQSVNIRNNHKTRYFTGSHQV